MQISSNTALKTIDANAISGPKCRKPVYLAGLRQIEPFLTPSPPRPEKEDFGDKKGRFWTGHTPFRPAVALFWPDFWVKMAHFRRRRSPERLN